MFKVIQSEKVVNCLCVDEESTGQSTPLTEPVELDDTALDAVVGGVICCSMCSASVSRSASPDCCIA